MNEVERRKRRGGGEKLSLRQISSQNENARDDDSMNYRRVVMTLLNDSIDERGKCAEDVECRRVSLTFHFNRSVPLAESRDEFLLG